MIDKILIEKYRDAKERLYKKFSKFRHVETLEGPNVLVLSPHPDDDVFGCGGTLKKHIEQGHTIQVVYLCSGDKGIEGLRGETASALRREEAITASQKIDIAEENLFFLENPDNELKPNTENIEKIKNIVQNFSPNLIYLPSLFDNNRDHFNTNLILKACKFKGIKIAAYEVWTPLIPNRLVDISTFIDFKIKAIKAHKSQLNELDYLNAILGLNQYRAKMYAKKKMDYAEAFLFMDIEDYFALWK